MPQIGLDSVLVASHNVSVPLSWERSSSASKAQEFLVAIREIPRVCLSNAHYSTVSVYLWWPYPFLDLSAPYAPL
ncbi:hypothetical protein A2U01_0026143, partial [Trifolium medium]|nr:hypothetical protein [Trifolium medium]